MRCAFFATCAGRCSVVAAPPRISDTSADRLVVSVERVPYEFPTWRQSDDADTETGMLKFASCFVYELSSPVGNDAARATRSLPIRMLDRNSSQIFPTSPVGKFRSKSGRPSRSRSPDRLTSGVVKGSALPDADPLGWDLAKLKHLVQEERIMIFGCRRCQIPEDTRCRVPCRRFVRFAGYTKRWLKDVAVKGPSENDCSPATRNRTSSCPPH